MNIQNLHRLIERYEDNLESTMNAVHYEQMKWQAACRFQEVWFSEESNKLPFSEKFKKACSESSVIINNSTITPTNGIVKLAEIEPEAVEPLFCEVLFADDGDDIALRQKNMDAFMDEIETLRLKYFPKYWKYQQDRHAVSCYLAFFAPAKNYIYRYSDAQLFAKYVEYSQDLGAGSWFSLPNYYQLCDLVVDALKQHPSLLAKLEAKLDSRCKVEDDLHIMAFDLMYCCRCYNYYIGLSYVKRNSNPKQAALENAEKERRQMLQERIDAFAEEKDRLEQQLAETECVSLLGTQVSTPSYGDGIIVGQEENKITVNFGSFCKSYKLHRKYVQRPVFEDNEEILDLMSVRADILDHLNFVQKEILRCQNALRS